MLDNVLKYNAENDSDDDVTPVTPITPGSTRSGGMAGLRKKIMAVGRMARVYKILREESENCVQLKSLTTDQKIPYGLLMKGKEAIKKGFNLYEIFFLF